MNVLSVLGTVSTVLAVLTFAGIVLWAYGRGRKRAFEEAANAPFALADEGSEHAPRSGGSERKS